MTKTTYANIIGFYIEPAQRPSWTGEILDRKTGELVKEPSMTKQSFKDECDINNIVRDFTPQVMAELTRMNLEAGRYQDLPDSADYQEMIEMTRRTQADFESLPAKIRARFDNDPLKFLRFFQDPANQEEAIKLGLAKDTRPPPKSPETGSTEAPAPKATPTPPKVSEGS